VALSPPFSEPSRLRANPWWRRWELLPRDARDTLFLLFVIAWTVLPHLTHLPLWCSLLTAAVLLWRAKLALSNAPLPGRWMLVGTLLLAAGLTFWSFRTLLGKEAGVTMVVVLMALKTLELRARRDAFVVFFLGFFLILTHFLYSQSLPVAAAMIVSVWGLLTALVLAHMPVGQPSLRQASALAARTALLGAPIMALLFVLFPRVGPLWGVPQDGRATTGLSNVMRMGSVAEAAQDDSILLRLRFRGAPPLPQSLYFRGPVLAHFDGVEWRPSSGGAGGATRNTAADVQTDGDALSYEMTLEPLKLNALPLLDAAVSAPAIEGYQVSLAGALQWRTDRPVYERLRFNAVSYPEFQYGAMASALELRESTELPQGYNPRALRWAAELRKDPVYAHADAHVLAQRLLSQIRTGGFSYTLAPGEYGRDAVDEFWFDRRQGFCEHFAASFVVLMRALGVPARVVTGFQGMDPAPIDGYYSVRASSAHAWAEYWEPASGWIRVDPTAAVAPDRINGNRRLAPPPGLVADALERVSPALLEQWRSAWEAVNNRWNQWVLNYSHGQQTDLLKNFGFVAPDWADLGILLVSAFSALAGLGAAWAWWDRHRIDPWVRQMDQLRAALKGLGLTASPAEPPGTLARRVRERFGPHGQALAEQLETLERQRYGRESLQRPDRTLTRTVVAMARALRARGVTG